MKADLEHLFYDLTVAAAGSPKWDELPLGHQHRAVVTQIWKQVIKLEQDKPWLSRNAKPGSTVPGPLVRHGPALSGIGSRSSCSSFHTTPSSAGAPRGLSKPYMNMTVDVSLVPPPPRLCRRHPPSSVTPHAQSGETTSASHESHQLVPGWSACPRAASKPFAGSRSPG